MPNTDTMLNLAQLRKHKLRRGFKAEAKRISARVRREVGVDPRDAMDCFRLAAHLGIRVVRLTALPQTPGTRHLSDVDQYAMSAATVRAYGRVGIWLNDTQPLERQQASLAHEIGHVILEHIDSPPLDDTGCREIHADIEAEADYLGSVLLITDEAAVAVARAGLAVGDAARRLGVSEQMLRWRLNDSGAMVRVARERQR